MLYLSRKFRLAVSAVLYIAYQGGGRPVRSTVITARYHVPKRYLEPMLQQLVKVGILQSERGPRGGYLLAKDRAAITIADVARAISLLQEELQNQHAAKDIFEEHVLSPLWQEMQVAIFQQLSTTTMQDLCNRAHRLGVSSAGQETFSYAI